MVTMGDLLKLTSGNAPIEAAIRELFERINKLEEEVYELRLVVGFSKLEREQILKIPGVLEAYEEIKDLNGENYWTLASAVKSAFEGNNVSEG